MQRNAGGEKRTPIRKAAGDPSRYPRHLRSALAQGELGRRDGEVKVVAHEHVGLHLPAKIAGRFKQNAHKAGAGAFGCKQIPAVVAAVDHVV
jgi:hypothetical protein